MRLDEIRKRLGAATPGPWLQEERLVYALEHHGWRKGKEEFRNRFDLHVGGWHETPELEKTANATFIAAAPEDIAYLLARVEKLEGLLTRLLPAVEFKRDPADSIAAMKAVDELRELARTLLAGEESKDEVSD